MKKNNQAPIMIKKLKIATVRMFPVKKFEYLPPAYVVRREGTVFTGVCLSTGGGGGVPDWVPPRGVPDWVPPRGSGYPPGGVPSQVPPGGVPGQVPPGGVPGPPPGGGGGT